MERSPLHGESETTNVSGNKPNTFFSFLTDLFFRAKSNSDPGATAENETKTSDTTLETPQILTGLIGWPLEQVQSPAMHNAAFKASGINGHYVLLPTPPELLNDAVQGLRALGFRGVNVTKPYKQAIIPFLDELSPTAQAIGAVNTIIIDEDRKLKGENTDADSFMAELQTLSALRAADIQALVLGAGSSARAIAYALASHHIRTRVVTHRTHRTIELFNALAPHLPEPNLLSAHSCHDLFELSPVSTLIVNCTSIGICPDAKDSPWPDDIPLWPWQMVYDLIYTPKQTKLMTQAQSAGARAFNGLGMMVQREALAWEMWSERPAPIAVMRTAVE